MVQEFGEGHHLAGLLALCRGLDGALDAGEALVDGPEDGRDVVEGDFLFHTSLMFLDIQGQR